MITPDNIRFEGVLAFFTDRKTGIERADLSVLTGFHESALYLPLQKHTDRVLLTGADTGPSTGDAVITDEKGLLIGVRVADCLPVIIYDRMRSAAGIVHAGWRGTARGILRKCLIDMMDRFSSKSDDIVIALGPAIRWCCYAVGEDVLSSIEESTGPGDYIRKDSGKEYLDIPSANKLQALSAGIPEENIWVSGDCTHCMPEKYYSYRYSGTDKRQGGFIGMIK